MNGRRTLGINGLGRIGKLTLWYQLAHDDFDRFVVNIGRPVGRSLDSLAEYIAKDSTYGPLHRYLDGYRGKRSIEIVDAQAGILRIHGKEVVVLQENRNPKDLPWSQHEVRIVVDGTGVFVDPHPGPEAPKGSLRGHLEGGAQVVLQTSAFKSKTQGWPKDSLTAIYGINHHQFEAGTHQILAAASCTTTALAHMMRPLLERDLTRHMITAGMSTVHAATNSQNVLDGVPEAGAKDLRKTRSALSNVILTTTNAARALEQVMPEIRGIGFMANSVRIPTSTVSLIILNVTFQTDLTPDGKPSLDRHIINSIYHEASQGESRGLVGFSEEQNVSQDMVGEDVAVYIEGCETHTRTGLIDIRLPNTTAGSGRRAQIPVTHVTIFGWYDNELGSYSNRLGELTRYVSENL